jgi:hypothetical protein
MSKIAFAWYKPEDWKRLREISADSDQLEESFQEWLIQANDGFNQARKSGLDVTKLFIDLDELKTWCEKEKLKINSDSRSQFAAYKLGSMFIK